MEKALGCSYSHNAQKTLNVHCSDRVTNETLYGKLPRLSDKISARRLRLTGHCQRNLELGMHRLTVGTNPWATWQRPTIDDI